MKDGKGVKEPQKGKVEEERKGWGVKKGRITKGEGKGERRKGDD